RALRGVRPARLIDTCFSGTAFVAAGTYAPTFVPWHVKPAGHGISSALGGLHLVLAGGPKEKRAAIVEASPSATGRSCIGSSPPIPKTLCDCLDPSATSRAQAHPHQHPAIDQCAYQPHRRHPHTTPRHHPCPRTPYRRP